MSPMKMALAGCLSFLSFQTAFAQAQAVPSSQAESQMWTPEFISELFKEKDWLSQQWDKAQVSGDAPLNLTAGGFDTSWKYIRTVQPAFIEGSQQLLDTWSANINTNTGALKITTGPYSGSAGVGAQVTFSRIFKTKSEALLTKPYTFWQMVPWTHKQAIELLKAGEAVRMELSMDLGVGTSTGGTVGKYGAFGVGVNYARGVRFLVDIYKLKDSKVRMRMVSQRNNGSASASASVNLLSGADLGTGIVRNFVTRFVDDCNLANSQMSLANVNDPPVDTEMFDYIFNLDSAEAQVAYNSVMKSIGSFDYKEMFNPFLIIKGNHAYSEKMSEQFRAALSPADELFQVEKVNPQGLRKVDRWFRGVTRTALNGRNAGTSCMNAWNLNYNENTSKTLIKNYDRNDQLTFQTYENTASEGKRSIAFGTWETITKNSINTLFNASYESDKTFKETMLSDLIVSHDRRSKDFSPATYKEVKAHLAFILPAGIYEAIDWGLFDKTADLKKNNVSYHYDLIFHKESLVAMPELSRSKLEEKLLAYAKKYPDSNWLDISPNQPVPPGVRASVSEAGTYNPPLQDRFDYDVSLIAPSLEVILSKDPKYSAYDRARAFDVVRGNILFRQIGAGFMITLLPADRAESLVAFRVNLNGPNGMSVSKSIGTSAESKVYSSVDYILKLLADRSFDLRLQVDSAGTVTPMSQKAEMAATPLQ